MSNFFNPLRLEPVNLFDGVTVAASTTSSPSDRLPTYKDSKLHIYVENSGTSGHVMVTIYSTDSDTSTKKGIIKEFELGMAGSNYEFGWIDLDTPKIPAYIYSIAENIDPENSATISVTVDRYR